MAGNIRRFFPGGHDLAAVNTIRELYPLWKVTPGGIPALFAMFGGAWILALPVLFCAIPLLWRSPRPALTLLALWGLLMTIAGVLQLRMLIYSGPAVALAAGVGAAWLVRKIGRFRLAAALAFAVFFLAAGLPAVIQQTKTDGGPDAGWRAALDWLRHSTPEPMGDAAAWWKLWPRLRPGQAFTYPSSAYGVLTWWDYGDWVNALAHRLPSSNGTQVHSETVAGFLTAIDQSSARHELRRLTAHYVVLDPQTITSLWPTVALWSTHDVAEYTKTLYVAGDNGRAAPVIVYLPDYYRSMAVHLYVFDGRASAAPSEVSVFTSRRVSIAPGREVDELIGVRKFPSVESAYAYMAVPSSENMTLGSSDPAISCAELDDLPWARRVFTSDETPMRPGRAPRAVKVFEVTP